MRITKENELAAPCGTYCGECVCFKAKDDPALLESLVARGIKREKLPCSGCRPGNGDCPVLPCDCATYTCVEEHGIDFCFECAEFPCPRLNPAADRAAVLPHNIKIFNLCFIKEQGLAKFVAAVPEIQKRYFQGKMVVGQGPQLEEGHEKGLSK